VKVRPETDASTGLKTMVPDQSGEKDASTPADKRWQKYIYDPWTPPTLTAGCSFTVRDGMSVFGRLVARSRFMRKVTAALHEPS
jgi:hypothetical protein